MMNSGLQAAGVYFQTPNIQFGVSTRRRGDEAYRIVISEVDVRQE